MLLDLESSAALTIRGCRQRRSWRQQRVATRGRGTRPTTLSPLRHVAFAPPLPDPYTSVCIGRSLARSAHPTIRPSIHSFVRSFVPVSGETSSSVADPLIPSQESLDIQMVWLHLRMRLLPYGFVLCLFPMTCMYIYVCTYVCMYVCIELCTVTSFPTQQFAIQT